MQRLSDLIEKLPPPAFSNRTELCKWASACLALGFLPSLETVRRQYLSFPNSDKLTFPELVFLAETTPDAVFPRENGSVEGLFLLSEAETRKMRGLLEKCNLAYTELGGKGCCVAPFFLSTEDVFLWPVNKFMQNYARTGLRGDFQHYKELLLRNGFTVLQIENLEEITPNQFLNLLKARNI